MKSEVIGAFRKSSHSTQEGACVEVAPTATGGNAIRDSKNPTGPRLAFCAGAWGSFVAALKDGDRS
ncbi:DUF397 domain-containing protein [Streptomyces sp. NPDC093097]|uniref:DUF397 domain-containing protein n=1 Tax=Streptomyces sp. NPDC093097 TaxID=3366027 RepID=UPI003811D4B1